MQGKEARPLSQNGVCECGLRAAPGEFPCEARRDQLLARDFEQPALYWRHHRMAIDAYCLQHSTYVASAKSFAAHLCGLLIAVEHGNDADMLRQLQRWLSTNPNIQKLALPVFRGEITIGQLSGIEDPVEFGQAVVAWGHSVWQAYGDSQPQAREWIIRSSPNGVRDNIATTAEWHQRKWKLPATSFSASDRRRRK